jgi:hypothetical protein
MTSSQRRRIRRVVRLGQALEGTDAQVASWYATTQCGRLGMRWFWMWFLPGLLLALTTATQIHPVMIGVVLALGAQALFARRNLRRAAAAPPAAAPT